MHSKEWQCLVLSLISCSATENPNITEQLYECYADINMSEVNQSRVALFQKYSKVHVLFSV